MLTAHVQLIFGAEFVDIDTTLCTSINCVVRGFKVTLRSCTWFEFELAAKLEPEIAMDNVTERNFTQRKGKR